MKIRYEPGPENGPTICKYNIPFSAGEVKEVQDPEKIRKMLLCPYFTEVGMVDGVEVLMSKKKRVSRGKD